MNLTPPYMTSSLHQLIALCAPWRSCAIKVGRNAPCTCVGLLVQLQIVNKITLNTNTSHHDINMLHKKLLLLDGREHCSYDTLGAEVFRFFNPAVNPAISYWLIHTHVVVSLVSLTLFELIKMEHVARQKRLFFWDSYCVI